MYFVREFQSKEALYKMNYALANIWRG